MDPPETKVVERVVRLTVEQFTRRVHIRLGQLDMTTKDLSKRLGVNRTRISQHTRTALSSQCSPQS